jgi:hypothetical protein
MNRNDKNNIRDLCGAGELWNDYQPKSNLVDENDDLHAGPHTMLNRWKNYCYQLLNYIDSVMLGK